MWGGLSSEGSGVRGPRGQVLAPARGKAEAESEFRGDQQGGGGAREEGLGPGRAWVPRWAFGPELAHPALRLLHLVWAPVRGSCLWGLLVGFCSQEQNPGLGGEAVTSSPGQRGEGERVSYKNRGSIERGLLREQVLGEP